jgi:hypothetical protein
VAGLSAGSLEASVGRDWHLADIRGSATFCPLLE